MMRWPVDTMTTTRRLPYGGLVEVQYDSNGKVRLHVDTQAHVSNLVAEVDRLRDELARFGRLIDPAARDAA